MIDKMANFEKNKSLFQSKPKETVWRKILENIPAIIAGSVAVVSLFFSISNDKRTSNLDTKQFDLSLFELSLPYFNSYLSSAREAFPACQVIAQLGLRESKVKSGKILVMLQNTIEGDTRIPETGPRPADQCGVYLADIGRDTTTDGGGSSGAPYRSSYALALNSIPNNKTNCDSPITTEANACIIHRFEKNLPAAKNEFMRLEGILQRAPEGLGELRLYFTGQHFRVLIFANLRNANDPNERQRLRLIQDVYLNPNSTTAPHEIINMKVNKNHYCEIDLTKTYSKPLFNSVYVEGTSCNTFPETSLQDSTPP